MEYTNIRKKSFWFAISIINSICGIIIVSFSLILFRSIEFTGVVYLNKSFWIIGWILSIPVSVVLLFIYFSWKEYFKED